MYVNYTAVYFIFLKGGGVRHGGIHRDHLDKNKTTIKKPHKTLKAVDSMWRNIHFFPNCKTAICATWD